MAISNSENQPQTTKPTPLMELETAKCYSCGFTEECTPAYAHRIRERYHGRWICGLCVEAVKDEAMRSDRFITTEEALNRHIAFCKSFRSSNPGNQTEHPILVMGRVLRRSLDSSSPRALRSSSTSALPGIDAVKAMNSQSLVRSGSCFSSLS